MTTLSFLFTDQLYGFKKNMRAFSFSNLAAKKIDSSFADSTGDFILREIYIERYFANHPY